MVNKKRDDFSAKVKRTLADRVGSICSNPECGRQTFGPSSNKEQAVSLGKAAHITAAASRGPRYDASLTAEERSDISNGIWLCSNCAELVDKDTNQFTVDRLKQWKKSAEERASENFNASTTAKSDDNIESITTHMLTAAANDIASFRNSKVWPSQTISLNLTFLNGDKQTSVTLDHLAKTGSEHIDDDPQSIATDDVTKIINEIKMLYLVSQPGTGKTTTLIQLVDNIIKDSQIACFVPLGEWSSRTESFFEFLARRKAFQDFQFRHFMQVADYKCLILVLDGLNELNGDAKKLALDELKKLQRELSKLVVIIGTRQQTISTCSSATIKIEALSNEQQRELAKKLRGKEGEAIIGRAQRIAGLRELISVPLYLNALLANAPATVFPKTKEEILSTFLAQYENTPEKAVLLHEKLMGFHKDILIRLAVVMNQAATTTLSDEKARSAISDATAFLKINKQLTEPFLQPVFILDVLINAHALVRTMDGVAFQHQQFQEWYASFEVERLIIEAMNNNLKEQKNLKANVLNWLAWEESILFACERLSKNTENTEAVAQTIFDAIFIDPMLAAQMIYSSTSEVWSHISSNITNVVKRWHTPHKIDRAMRFMIKTGRPEFAEHIWALVLSNDDEVCWNVFQAVKSFPLSVLGSDLEQQLEKLSEIKRCEIIPEIGWYGGFDAIELVANIAKKEQSVDLVLRILDILRFRHADHYVTDILQTASEKVWHCIAREVNFKTLPDNKQNARLAKLRRDLIIKGGIIKGSDVIRIINYFVNNKYVEVGIAERITQFIQSPNFPINDARVLATLKNALKIYPDAVVTGIIQRIIKYLPMPSGIHKFLENAKPIDSGFIATMVLDQTITEDKKDAAYSVVGPKIVGRMLDIFLQSTKQEQQKNYSLKNAIAKTNEASFLLALLERAKSNSPYHIQLMASLVVQHGRKHIKEQFQVSSLIKKQLIAIFEHWVKIMLTSPEANRHHAAEVVYAIQRLPHQRLLPSLKKLWENDFRQRNKEFKEAKQKWGMMPGLSAMCYERQYNQAFIAIGDTSVTSLMKKYLRDMRCDFRDNFNFSVNAARVLLGIWNRSNTSESDFSERIFDVVRELVDLEDQAMQKQALRLAEIALMMPCGAKSAEIDKLFNLPLLYATKRSLFQVAARAGEVLPSKMLIAGFDELLKQVDNKTLEFCRLNEVMEWVELFLFSDRPLFFLEALDLLPEICYQPQYFDRLLKVLGHSPHDGSLQVLKALAERRTEMLQNPTWFTAMECLGTEESARTMFDLIYTEKKGKENPNAKTWQFFHQFTSFLQKFPALCSEIFEHYKEMKDGIPKTILEDILIEVADAEIILGLIYYLADKGRSYDDRLSKAMERLAIGQRPISDWTNAFELFSIPLVEFRKKLLSMAQSDKTQASLAKVCLNKIEELRDEYGRISNEPRHPDICSGISVI